MTTPSARRIQRLPKWRRAAVTSLCTGVTTLTIVTIAPTGVGSASAAPRTVTQVEKADTTTISAELADDSWTGSLSIDHEVIRRSGRVVTDLRRAWIQMTRRDCDRAGTCVEYVRRVTSTTATPVVDAKTTRAEARTSVAKYEYRSYRVTARSSTLIAETTTFGPLHAVATAGSAVLRSTFTEVGPQHRTTSKSRQVDAAITVAWADASYRSTSGSLTTATRTTTTYVPK